MKKILSWFFVCALVVTTANVVRAQDTATQQQIDKLSGQIQDLLDAQSLQDKRISSVEKKITDLQDKLNKPAAADTASADDLKKLATQVQELAKKQQSDNDLILKELEKLGKGGGGGSSSSRHSSGNSETSAGTSASNSSTTPGGPQKGYYYEVKSGDTPSAISKAYRAQGIKVTTEQILAANPGLDANKLVVGKKIFIPDPNAK